MGKATDSDYLKHKGKYPKNNKIFSAMFIDLIVVNIIAIIVIKIYAAIFGGFMNKYSLSYGGFALYLVCLLYVPLLSSMGQTLGQKVMGIMIRNVDGSKMRPITAIRRWLFSIISPFGYNHKKVPWFDRRYDTVLLLDK